MSNSILTVKHAEDLNNLVQLMIDPRLFLICNYEPTVRHAVSADGIYLLNIQDLYKFAIDSSCVIKQYYKVIPKSNHGQFWRLRSLLDQISTFRTVFDHNISTMDGQISANTFDSYIAWVSTVIGKANPESSEDFNILNQKLSDMAIELIQLLKKFIHCVSQIPDRNHTVCTWIDMTLYWYSNNTKTDIYKGNLIGAYIAHAKLANINTDDVYWIRGIHRKVNRWIESAMFHPVQSRIDQTAKEVEYFEEILAGKNLRFEEACRKLSSTKAEALLNQFRQSLKEKQQELYLLNREMDTLKVRIGSEPVKYFYRNLENQLRETIESLNSNGITYTLLPQDLIQEDIARVFRGIPSPEGDFKSV